MVYVFKIYIPGLFPIQLRSDILTVTTMYGLTAAAVATMWVKITEEFSL